MKTRALMLVVFCAILPQAAAAVIDLKVRTDRTALWVGDRMEYIVRVEYDPGVEFIRDHLKKEEMNLQPFEILDVSSTTGSLSQGRKFLEVRLRLTIYDVSHAEVAVPSFNLFYFRQGQAQSKEDSPAETLAVPALPVALRSTVVDSSAGIRDYKEVLPIRPAAWLLPMIAGWCGLAVIVGYAAWLAVLQIRSGFWKQKTAERIRKKSLLESVEEIRQKPVESAADLEDFYRRAAEILRGIAAEKLGDGAGLTPREMQAALQAAGSEERRAAAIGELMEQCDLIRYAPGGLEQGRRVRPEFVDKLARLTEHH